MEFSEYIYFCTLPNKELKDMLHYILRDENIQEYYHAIPDIIKVMEERGMLIDP